MHVGVKDTKKHEQWLNERSKFNFQTRNKTRLHESKTKTQDMYDKHENEYLLC